MSPTLARTPDPIALDIAERRKRLNLSQPQLSVLASVPLMSLNRFERGVGRCLREDEAARVLHLLRGIEHLRAECAGLPLASAS